MFVFLLLFFVVVLFFLGGGRVGGVRLKGGRVDKKGEVKFL